MRGFLLFIALFSCSKDAPQRYLEVSNYTASEFSQLSINQPIVIKFSDKLQRPIRRSAVSITDDSGNRISGYDFVIVGNSLEIIGALPTSRLLDDATFAPSSSYTISLRGLPAVAAIRSENALFLRKDTLLKMSFLKLEDDGVLSAFEADTRPLRIVNLSTHNVINVSGKQKIVLHCDGAIDPRSLSVAEVVVASADQHSISCKIKLLSNTESSAILEITLPVFSGTAYLVLPKSIEGIGGRQLLPSMRQFRLLADN